MRFPSVTNRTQPIILFYSGFLTDNGERGAALTKEGRDDWHHAINGFFDGMGTVYRASWAAGQLSGLCTIDFWTKAVRRADMEAEKLAAWLDTHDHPTIIAGHSLGGRIVLKAAQLARQSVPNVVAFAPAMCMDDIRMNKLYSPHRTVEIYRSTDDDVLRSAYRAGQHKVGKVVGLDGIRPKPCGNRGVHCLNANEFPGIKNLGHNDYAAILYRFRKASPLHREWRAANHEPQDAPVESYNLD